VRDPEENFKQAGQHKASNHTQSEKGCAAEEAFTEPVDFVKGVQDSARVECVMNLLLEYRQTRR
jgi:hypothetical protein